MSGDLIAGVVLLDIDENVVTNGFVGLVICMRWMEVKKNVTIVMSKLH